MNRKRPMKQSKPGKKLSPELFDATNAIYHRDHSRYIRLIKWVWLQQSLGYSDEEIIACFNLAGENVHTADNWWKYLTALRSKACGRALEEESKTHKKSFDLSSVGEILRGIVR